MNFHDGTKPVHGNLGAAEMCPPVVDVATLVVLCAVLFGSFATKRALEFVAVGSAAYWVE